MNKYFDREASNKIERLTKEQEQLLRNLFNKTNSIVY